MADRIRCDIEIGIDGEMFIAVKRVSRIAIYHDMANHIGGDIEIEITKAMPIVV